VFDVDKDLRAHPTKRQPDKVVYEILCKRVNTSSDEHMLGAAALALPLQHDSRCQSA
jgi:hypothetical protein